MVNIHFELFCTLQDQPERRSANYIMLGTSNYTARWGVAGDFAAVVSGIPACKTCWSNLLQDDVRVLCEDCVNWDTNSRNGLMDFKPPLDYPESEVPSSGKLSPKRLTYAILQEVVETAHEKFVNMDWTKKNVQKFLTVHGVNTEACNAVLERANNCLSLTMEKAYFDTNGPTIDYDSLLKRQREQRIVMRLLPSTSPLRHYIRASRRRICGKLFHLLLQMMLRHLLNLFHLFRQVPINLE